MSRLPIVVAALVAAVLAGTVTLPAQERGRRLFPPEELGVLEGPDRDAWQKPELIMVHGSWPANGGSRQ